VKRQQTRKQTKDLCPTAHLLDNREGEWLEIQIIAKTIAIGVTPLVG